MKKVHIMAKGLMFLATMTLWVLVFTGSATGHEIWFYCPQKDVRIGDTVRLEYGVGETLFETPDPNWVDWLSKEIPAVKVWVIDPDGKKSEIKLKVEENVLSGAFVAQKKGSYIAYYVRENDYLTKTVNGWKRQKPDGVKNVIKAINSNFYQKVIINVEQSSDNLFQEFGDSIEIVPVDDPSRAKPGDEIRFKVTYKGKSAPMDVFVWGSYPGYSKHSHNWCYFGIPDKDGLIYFKPLRNGPWQVGAEKNLDEAILLEKQKTGIKGSYSTAVTFWIP